MKEMLPNQPASQADEEDRRGGVRVLVCDEMPIVRDGIATLLDAEDAIHMVDATDSGLHAIMLTRQHRPHVVVTGLDLNGISGLELLERLQREPLEPEPRVVVLALNDTEETVTKVIDAGANGLLFKGTTREELISAIRAAADGYTMLAPQITQRLVDSFRHGHGRIDKDLRPAASALTYREREVLQLLAQGLSIDDVAGVLHIGVTTVRTHIYRLRCKLDLKDRAQLVSFAFRSGLTESA